MAFVVTEACIKCKYTDCVEVCPVEAIFSEDEVPAGQEEFKKLNADLAKKWPVITEKKPAPPDAKQFEGVSDKKKLLET